MGKKSKEIINSNMIQVPVSRDTSYEILPSQRASWADYAKPDEYEMIVGVQFTEVHRDSRRSVFMPLDKFDEAILALSAARERAKAQYNVQEP